MENNENRGTGSEPEEPGSMPAIVYFFAGALLLIIVLAAVLN